MANNSMWYLQFFEGKKIGHAAHESIIVEPLQVENRENKKVFFLAQGTIMVEKYEGRISITRTGNVGKKDLFECAQGELMDVIKLLLQFDLELKLNSKKIQQ